MFFFRRKKKKKVSVKRPAHGAGGYEIRTTIKLPEEWREAIERYMERNGITSFADLIRHLIRRVVIEGEE